VFASASASGSSSGTAAKTASTSYCPPRTICLWSDSRFRGTKGEYHCAGRRGFSGTIDIRKRFPLPPDNGHRGVSSYKNTGVRSAALNSYNWNSVLPLKRGSHNVPRNYNDGAMFLRISC
jgi:hypothetical protein